MPPLRIYTWPTRLWLFNLTSISLGNGYVGQAMIREALLTHHAHVISVNRSGPPSNFTVPHQSRGRVDWISGDAYDGASYREVLQGCDGAISCIGAFGSNQMMEKVNGDTNIQAIRECFRAGAIH